MSKVLNDKGQYTDEFIDFLNTLRPLFNEIQDKTVEFLNDIGARGIDYQIAPKMIVDDLDSRMLSVWLDKVDAEELEEYNNGTS